MTTTTASTRHPSEVYHGRRRLLAHRDLAAERLYRAELALHDAHQSHVDAWINAAADRLHQAVVMHNQALATLANDSPNSGGR